MDEIKQSPLQAHREIQRIPALQLVKLIGCRRTINSQKLASLAADGDQVIYV